MGFMSTVSGGKPGSVGETDLGVGASCRIYEEPSMADSMNEEEMTRPSRNGISSELLSCRCRSNSRDISSRVTFFPDTVKFADKLSHVTSIEIPSYSYELCELSLGFVLVLEFPFNLPPTAKRLAR